MHHKSLTYLIRKKACPIYQNLACDSSSAEIDLDQGRSTHRPSGTNIYFDKYYTLKSMIKKLKDLKIF